MRVRVDSEEEGEDSRGIKGGEGEAMHGEKEPSGDDEGVDDGGEGRAMEEGVEFVAEGGRGGGRAGSLEGGMDGTVGCRGRGDGE